MDVFCSMEGWSDKKGRRSGMGGCVDEWEMVKSIEKECIGAVSKDWRGGKWRE